MGKKNTTKSALKKSSNIFLKNTKSKLALQRLFNNFRESKSDNSTEVDQAPQCVFLGALCLKPVPDIFHVTLQPISSRHQSNKSILYNNNNSRTISNRGKLNRSRKGKNNTEVCQKSSTYCSQSAAINNNFFIGNISDQKSENKILKLFGKVKQSIQEETMDKSKVKEMPKDQTKNRKEFENKIGPHQKFSSDPTKMELFDHKLSTGKEFSKKVFVEKSFSELKITMPSEGFRDYRNVVHRGSYAMKQSNTLNSNVQNNSIEKDIAVENVIRQLRQKKNIEVKKVNDMDSKLKRITPMIDNKPKSEAYDQSKSFIINLDSYQPKNADIGQKMYSEEGETQSKGFLDLEEDDIEDYLEIDQNIVEDLQALIPEEEIESISNSLIQPEDYSSINSVEDTTIIVENKPEDMGLLVEPSSEDISISNSSKGEKSEITAQEIEHEIKKDENIENDGESQHDEDSPPNDSVIETSIKDTNESILINNNESSSEIDNKILPQFTTDVEIIEPNKRSSEEDIPEPKKRKISPKIEKSKPKKKERRSYKFKPNPNVSKNLRKITDFLIPNCIKIACPEEEKPEINEISITENSQNITTVPVQIDSSETIKSEENELPYKTRTLRSRSKPLKTINETKAQEIPSTHENKTPEENNKGQNITSESSSSISGDQIKIDEINEEPSKATEINKEPSKATEINKEPSRATEINKEPSKATEINSTKNICTNEPKNEIPILDETKSSKNTLVPNDDIQPKNELSNEEATTSEVAENMESRKKSELPKNSIKQNKCKRKPKRKNKGNSKILNFFNKSKEKSNTPKDEEKVIEIVALTPNEQSIVSKTDQREEVYIPETTIEAENKSEIRDSNENHVFTGSSVEKEQITAIEITENLSEKEQITAIETTEILTEKEQITTVETAESSIEREQISSTETANILSEKEQIVTESSTEKETISVTETTENSSEKEQIPVVETTKVKQTKKKRKRAVQRNKKSLKIQNESNIETNDTKIGEEGTTNGESASPQNSANNKIKGIQTKKGNSKPQKRNKNIDTEPEKILVSLDNNQTKVGVKNRETTLQIYDFDDESSDEEELPKKLVKKRKFRLLGVNDVVRRKLTDISPKKRSKFNEKDIRSDPNSDRPNKKQIKPENVNNNTADINPHESKDKSPTNFTLEDKTHHEDEKMSLDLNDTTSSKVILKTSPDTDEYGQDWKPLYGPYKRIDRCNVCLVAFKSYKKLRAHKKIHEVENPYKCSECDDCFEDVEKLAAHLRIHKDYDDEMDFSPHSEIDIPDIKPINVTHNKIKSYSKRRKLPASSESDETTFESSEETLESEKSTLLKNLLETPSSGRQTRSSQKHKKEKDIQIKIAEVKRKLCNAINTEAKDKQIGVKRKITRSQLKTELTNECSDESEESFLKYYAVPVEDQEEYSQVLVQESDTSLLGSEGVEVEISRDVSEIENVQEEWDDEENSEDMIDGVSLGMMNEMAEAEYLLEKDTNVSSKPKRKLMPKKKRKNGKSTKESQLKVPDIIKVKRDNLPPLILKSVRKKTLLLGKMPYPCKKCDATFWTSFQLERHQLVHVLKKVPPPAKPPSKVFKCEECGKVFKKICDLERHTRVHTGEKPSVCNICNKRFQQSYNLNKHLYTHTQEKNYECVICQKKFGRNDVLNRHVLTHSIVKPFRCSVCSRTFIRNSQLKLHLRKHHGLDKDPGNETNADDPVAGTSTKV